MTDSTPRWTIHRNTGGSHTLAVRNPSPNRPGVTYEWRFPITVHRGGAISFGPSDIARIHRDREPISPYPQAGKVSDPGWTHTHPSRLKEACADIALLCQELTNRSEHRFHQEE